MKNLLTYLTIILVFTSCLYSEPTYPSLDGTYILRSISINGVNIFDSELTDETYDNPMTIIYQNPIGPLDTMKVDKTRISISGNRFYIGYYLQNGGDHWKFKYDMNVTQDFITGQWVNMNVYYDTPSMMTYRHYVIIEDGLEYLKLECPKQYPDGPEGEEINYSLTFYREGP
jgi:hypothetical protein